ncbi:E3 ubiquitin-protein ligase TRIM47-like [Siphateles boraxobius]|uniref:E3 ubiquitin-protein ligase TRIM47-like n=1 Tax=Siphateles boraxobius TaxID=180520 RepID=UPI004062A872
MEDSHISLQTLWNAIQQSKSDMLTHFDVKMDVIHSRLTSIQNSLSTLGDQVNLLEQRVGANEDNVQVCVVRMQQLKKDNSYLLDKVDDLENRSRRSNLRFVGVQESSEGSDIVGFMSRLIPQLLGQDNFSIPLIIEWAHRSPTVRQSDRASPRPIMIKLLNFQDKVKILRIAREKKQLEYNGTRGTCISVVEDQFSCSICLDLLKDPVTIPCGHSYCMSCITDYWNKDDQKRVYSCPQCRETFTPRPALGKNTMLAEVVDKLKTRKVQTARTALSYAGPGDVECDFCTGRKRKAVKSCLMCLESYCQSHFKCHEESPLSKRHKVTDATGRLQEMICPQHERLLEVYCRTDQKCICLLCMMDEHKKHDTVSAEAERTEKQKQVEKIQGKFQQIVQERQKELQELREAVEIHKSSAQSAVEDSEKIFTKLIRFIKKSRSEVTQMIRDQEMAAVSRAEERLERLEQEIDDLRRRETDLEQLAHTDDHIHFLQSFQSLSEPLESTDASRVTVSSVLSYVDVRKPVTQLKEQLEKSCKEEMKKISGQVTNINIISIIEPKTTAQFPYLVDIIDSEESDLDFFL